MCNFKVVKGDLLNTKAQVIIHQTNCSGGFGSGVAGAIKLKWPAVAEKCVNACTKNIAAGNSSTNLLGKILPVKVDTGQVVINMYAQNEYGYDGQRYTSYDALDSCLRKVRTYCETNGYTTIALPYKMSSDRGGAEWDAVLAIIKGIFRDSNLDIEIRKL